MKNFLSKVVEVKKEELKKKKKILPLSILKNKITNSHNDAFIDALKNPYDRTLAFIAEVKLGSPSNKTLSKNIDIVKHSKEYKKAHVDAISYVSDERFFNGSTFDIAIIKNSTKLPILQKDFIIDPYQIYEAKEKGSDAILLITRLVSANKLQMLVNLALKIGIEPVVEIYDKRDLNKAVSTQTRVIAVNARNLENFRINTKKAYNLLKMIPNNFIRLGFSGIISSQQLKEYKDAGAHGVLVGTSLMQAKNIQKFIKEIRTI